MPPRRCGETRRASQCGALQAQFQVVATPLVAAPSGRLTRGYAWYGPPGRTWPARRLHPCDLGRNPLAQRSAKIGQRLITDARHAANVTPGYASEFHCPFGPSQLRRLGPKGPRNTTIVAVAPRAAHAFSVLALGWYVSRFQRFCRFAAIKCQIGQVRPGGPYHAYPRVRRPEGAATRGVTATWNCARRAPHWLSTSRLTAPERGISCIQHQSLL